MFTCEDLRIQDRSYGRDSARYWLGTINMG
jgi:hypothetical protein